MHLIQDLCLPGPSGQPLDSGSQEPKEVPCRGPRGRGVADLNLNPSLGKGERAARAFAVLAPFLWDA
ncbi:UNVERIFIED_CONTAM: hypothetical protein K2H54_010695 [Gekko kuhli]